MLLEALGFFVFAVLHLGLAIPLGVVVLEEPRRQYAVLVEGVAGLLLTLGVFAATARKSWAWTAATVAHLLALVGVLWGMVAIRAGRGPHTPLNDTFHGVMVVVLLAGLTFLLTPTGRRVMNFTETPT